MTERARPSGPAPNVNHSDTTRVPPRTTSRTNTSSSRQPMLWPADEVAQVIARCIALGTTSDEAVHYVETVAALPPDRRPRSLRRWTGARTDDELRADVTRTALAARRADAHPVALDAARGRLRSVPYSEGQVPGSGVALRSPR